MDVQGLLKHMGIKRTIPLTKSVQLCCPYHGETRPSSGIMINYPNWFHCFVCEKKKPLLEFLEYVTKKNPWECYKLAKKYGYNEDDVSVLKVEDIEPLSEDSLSEFTSELPKWFMKRGLSLATIKEWEICYDECMDRVVFPIRDEYGRLVGMCKRSKKRLPKYTFSKGTLKDILYGMNKISEVKFIILVEGFMDKLRLYDLGIKNVAALMGKAMTNGQKEVLLENTDKVVLALDNDKWGKEATHVLIGKLKNEVKLKVGKYTTSAKDPGEFKTKKEVLDFINKGVYV